LSVCLLDTSILCELLEIPGKCGGFPEVASELEHKVQQGESLLLPLTAVLETGNHIGQNGDGRQRRAAAGRFVRLVKDAIEGRTPFVPTPFEPESWRHLLDEFPDWASRGSGWGPVFLPDGSALTFAELTGVEKGAVSHRGRRGGR
jgi:hypothetical protein